MFCSQVASFRQEKLPVQKEQRISVLSANSSCQYEMMNGIEKKYGRNCRNVLMHILRNNRFTENDRHNEKACFRLFKMPCIGIPFR